MLRNPFLENLPQFAYALLGAIIIAIFAQMTIDLPKIPITGQSLAVLVVAYILGKKWGVIAVFIYLAMGLVGLPVFADWTGGWEKITGGSGGFLYGFVFAAYGVGKLGERKGWACSFPKALIAMAVGTAIILFFGVTHLSSQVGLEKALEYGFYPFIAGAIIKIFLGALLIPIYCFFTIFIKVNS